MKKIEELVKICENVTDPRRKSGNFRHKLTDIIVIGLLTTICKGEDFTDMENFGKEREDWLKGFLELPSEIPDSDTFRRVFERINPTELSGCLYDWLKIKREERGEMREIISVDGKTICGSGDTKHKAYHVVSAFVFENSLTLGEICVDEKSNEITAVPELLDLIDVSGAIVTADAMSCQKAICKKIVEEKADFVIGLKENQPSLFDDVRLYFADFQAESAKFLSHEKNHGRIEKREYFLETDIEWLEQKPLWSGLAGIGMVKSRVLEKEIVREETRYFITSLTDVDEFARSVRGHWGIENGLHWHLDVTFGEDNARQRKDNSPLNMNVLRKVALNLLKSANWGRIGLKKKMYIAALNPKKLQEIVFGDF